MAWLFAQEGPLLGRHSGAAGRQQLAHDGLVFGCFDRLCEESDATVPEVTPDIELWALWAHERIVLAGFQQLPH
jgi:hypothetical protein